MEITDRATCAATFPFFGDARIAAGGPLADDVMKCQLRPLDPRSYAVTFTAGQWARLRAAFPTGVCDWRRRGGDQRPSVSWGKFAVWAELLRGLGLRGDERLLDMGCGRGAVLLMAAQLLPAGRAVGVDLWKTADQSGNAPEVAEANARREGVADRVELRTGDM